MYYMKSVLMTIALVVVSHCWASSDPAQSGKVTRVLTIGNSFSQNASRYLKDLAAGSGCRLVYGTASIGGCWLGKHWAAVEAAEANPSDPAGRPYSVTLDGKEVMLSLREILLQDKWDIVTIQQSSPKSTDLGTYHPYARKLRDYIKKHAPQAEVLVHQTWAYRCDDPGITPGGYSEERMYRDLSSAYRSVASELGLRIIPVGDAFYAADTNRIWRYSPAGFDPSRAVYPDLPDQSNSLHVGYQWNRNAEGQYELSKDCRHANANGCYLAGCVWFEVLFGKSVVDNKFVPSEITPQKAAFLRRVAHRAVVEASDGQ